MEDFVSNSEGFAQCRRPSDPRPEAKTGGAEAQTDAQARLGRGRERGREGGREGGWEEDGRRLGGGWEGGWEEQKLQK